MDIVIIVCLSLWLCYLFMFLKGCEVILLFDFVFCYGFFIEVILFFLLVGYVLILFNEILFCK